MSNISSTVEKHYPEVSKPCYVKNLSDSYFFEVGTINENNVIIYFVKQHSFPFHRIPESLDVVFNEDTRQLDVIAHYDDETTEQLIGSGHRLKNGLYSVKAILFSGLQLTSNRFYEYEEAIVPQGVNSIFLDGKIGFDRLVVPQSVHRIIIVDGCLKAEQIVFNGNLPEFELINSADFDRDDFIEEEIRINTPKKEVALPTFLAKAIERPMDSRRGPRKVIYSAPKLCEEESINPGYIRVTEITEDNIVEINTRYIISVEPLDIDRFEPVVGARIYLGSDADNYRRYYDVYEPQDMVVSKIREAVKKIDSSTLIAHFETLMNAKKFK